jgi:SAM-dependent methyltransferase
METYAFDNAKTVQRERLHALEATLDPGSTGHLAAIGVAPGWRCLEVGTGGGSVAAWLADRVGCAGEVLATDLDVTVARERVHGALSVQVHDLLVDPLPESRFDLVHARLLLAWLPQRQRALARLVRTLKPGGWLLVEEMDFASVVPAGLGEVADVQTFSRVLDAHLGALRTHNGFDAHCGRRLLGDLLAAGLEEVEAEGRVSVWRGGGNGMRIWRLTFAQLRDAMAAAGLPEGDVDRAIELCDDPGFAFVAPLVMAASGRRSRR